MTQQIIYYFSLNSPWSYLGDGRLKKIADQYDAKVVHKPTNFSIVFPETGGLPLPKRAPARRDYRMQELERWPALLNLPLVREPKYFPCDERLAAGMVIAASNEGLDVTDLVNSILTALWAEDLNIGETDTLVAIADKLGFDGQKLIQVGAGASVEEQWIENSKEAVNNGVFGAPTYLLGKHLFWGQDRLDFLDRVLASNFGSK